MGTDTRLGLVIGLGVVLAVAVVYFPKTGRPDRAAAVVPSLPAAAFRGADSMSKAPLDSRLPHGERAAR